MTVKAVELTAKILLTFAINENIPDDRVNAALEAHLEEMIASSTVSDVFEVGDHNPNAVTWRTLDKATFETLIADGCATAAGFIVLTQA